MGFLEWKWRLGWEVSDVQTCVKRLPSYTASTRKRQLHNTTASTAGSQVNSIQANDKVISFFLNWLLIMEIGVTHVTLNKRVKPEFLLALRQNSKLAQRGRYAYYIIYWNILLNIFFASCHALKITTWSFHHVLPVWFLALASNWVIWLGARRMLQFRRLKVVPKSRTPACLAERFALEFIAFVWQHDSMVNNYV